MKPPDDVKATEAVDKLLTALGDWDPEVAAEAIASALTEGRMDGMLGGAAEEAGVQATPEVWRSVLERLEQRVRWVKMVEARGQE